MTKRMTHIMRQMNSQRTRHRAPTYVIIFMGAVLVVGIVIIAVALGGRKHAPEPEPTPAPISPACPTAGSSC